MRFSLRKLVPFLAILGELIIALGIGIGAAFFWLDRAGSAKIAEVSAAVQQSTDEEKFALDFARGKLADAGTRLVATRAEKDVALEQTDSLTERGRIEREWIASARAREAEVTEGWLNLRFRVEEASGRLAACRFAIAETEHAIAAEGDRIAALMTSIEDRKQRLTRLDSLAGAARRELEREPPGHFPEKSALASLVDVGDAGNTYVVCLSRDVTGAGPWRIGVQGELGIGDEVGSALRAGGVYANLALIPRRASLDVEGGVSNSVASEGGEEDTSPFAAAMFRLAPLRRERFFLLAGTRYSHDDVGLRFGFGLGRR